MHSIQQQKPHVQEVFDRAPILPARPEPFVTERIDSRIPGNESPAKTSPVGDREALVSAFRAAGRGFEPARARAWTKAFFRSGGRHWTRSLK